MSRDQNSLTPFVNCPCHGDGHGFVELARSVGVIAIGRLIVVFMGLTFCGLDCCGALFRAAPGSPRPLCRRQPESLR
jgi:hypothetical protein